MIDDYLSIANRQSSIKHMKMLLKISLRNLFRQKRRNILLGIGIAFGMSILILSNAFSHGLSDILLNKIIKWMTGHILVTAVEKQDTREWRLLRDKERFIQIINERIEGDKEVYEGVSSQSGSGHTHSDRALGNGAAEFVVVVGIELDESFTDEVDVVAGKPEDIRDISRENPIMLYDTMAEKLNVGLNDTIRIRFTTAYGQVQAAQFTVVTLLKATNPFMSVASFTSLETMKPLVGLQPQETQNLSIIMNDLDDPRLVIEQAHLLHEALQPNAAGYMGTLRANGRERLDVQILAVQPETSIHQAFSDKISLRDGNPDTLWHDRQSIVLSQALAQSLGVQVGDSVTSSYETKFEGMFEPRPYRVSGIFEPNDLLSDNMAFLHEQEFYETCIPAIPKYPVDIANDSLLFPLLLKGMGLIGHDGG
jgi:ABC-type lipoprotein release transport system permease subunit